jgi:hypothetical protein
MFKYILLLVFGVLAHAGTGNVAMPEPSGIPELIIGIAGIGGYLAWRVTHHSRDKQQ